MFSKKVIIVIVFCVTTLLSTSLVYATSATPDNITLNTPEYETHTKGLVVFSHKKHTSEYGANCSDCHHDEKGNPLTLKEGDSVDRCVVCHKETGKKPKEEKLTKKESIKKYHKKAIHCNCKDCHKNFNNVKGLEKGDKGSAPQDCKGCHPSKKDN